MSDNELFWPSWGDDPRDTASRPTTPIATHADPSQSFGPYLSGEPQTPVRRRPLWLAPAAAAGAAALIFGGVGVGVGAALGHNNGTTTSDNGFTVGDTPVPASDSSPRSFAAIAAKVLPSVVSINVRGSQQSDTGSGVVLRSDGYVLTNNHVVAAAANGGTVSVVFNDGTTANARIVGTDQEDDLAVIKVAKTGLPAATLGSSSAVRVGDSVLAVGSPLGLTGTVTAGIVSALNRPVDTTQDQQQPTDPFGFQQQQQPSTTTVISAIQTDAAINPGNSGGPLLNAAGQVIGINSAIASTGSVGGQAGNIGVGFAIPIDQARIIAGELIKNGKASHPLMGVVLADATDSAGNALARVQSTTAGGPAAKAGIKVGDVIVAVAGQRTAGADAVIAAIRLHQPGQRVSVTVERQGSQHTVTVTLADAATAVSR
ncbi:MAG TPA: trypsin-like peptidase domain-containing protein [Mycobacteriales bacterium]|nr:trypsin-like peptidase domain-containing protein [Mycobacteriales bacterium]